MAKHSIVFPILSMATPLPKEQCQELFRGDGGADNTNQYRQSGDFDPRFLSEVEEIG